MSSSFCEVPDYEYPHDSDIDNEYFITLNISDGYASTQVNIVLAIGDIDDSASSADSAIHLFNGYVLGEGWRQASWFGTYFLRTISLGLSYRFALGVCCAESKWKYLDVEK